MNKKVKILRGVPGCGKSTHVRCLKAEWIECPPPGTETRDFAVVSADVFFIGRDGVYRFNPKLLGQAHAQCLKDFTAFVTAKEDSGIGDLLLVVDNTNTTVREMSTYVDLCKAHGIPFEIVTIDTPPEIAAHRNTHGVPVDKVFEMHRRLRAAQIPSDWPQIVVPGSF